MKLPVTAYIGLGSNLESPEVQIVSALVELKAIPSSRCLIHSSLYASPPMGPQNQPDYINAVVAIETHLEPHSLLQELQMIERMHQRQRKQRWGPRTLDLDLLLYGALTQDEVSLKIPHPGIALRAFVINPLLEIAPNLELPGLGGVRQLAAALPAGERDACIKITSINV